LEEVFIVTQSTQGAATMRMQGEPRVALVFELLEHDLLTRIAERRVNVTEAHHFLQQLLNGVAYMHAHNIFHRDIKCICERIATVLCYCAAAVCFSCSLSRFSAVHLSVHSFSFLQMTVDSAIGSEQPPHRESR
jgi:serine/threonine protein kinase